MRRRQVEEISGDVPDHLRQFVFDDDVVSPDARCSASEWGEQYEKWRRARNDWVESGGASRDLLEALSAPLPNRPFCGKLGCCL